VLSKPPRNSNGSSANGDIAGITSPAGCEHRSGRSDGKCLPRKVWPRVGKQQRVSGKPAEIAVFCGPVFPKNWPARTKFLDLAVSISESNLFRILEWCVNMALFEAEPIQDLGETNEALKFRLGRLIVEAASKHDPGLQSLIDEAIEVLGSNPLSDSRLILLNPMGTLRDFESV